MPALLAYLIAVTLLLGGGFGALSWLATPEPVKVAKATPKPPPPHYADNSKPESTQALPPQVSPPESTKPEASSKPAIGGTDEVKTAASDKAVASDQPPSEAPAPRPEPPVAASQREAKAEVSDPPRDQRDRTAQVARPQAAAEQKADQHADAQPTEAMQDDPAFAAPKNNKQSVQPVQPGNAQTVVSGAPAAKAAKRPHVRQASRGFEKRPLEVMTLRTVELPDGRRMNRLIPYRGDDRHRDNAPTMAFGPDE